MGNVLTVIVVTVFFVIVFRKRLALFLRSARIKQSSALPDHSGQDPLPVECISYEVMAFDLSKYQNDISLFSEDVTVQLRRKLDYLCLSGSVLKMDVIPFGRILLILISWHQRTAERN